MPTNYERMCWCCGAALETCCGAALETRGLCAGCQSAGCIYESDFAKTGNISRGAACPLPDGEVRS